MKVSSLEVVGAFCRRTWIKTLRRPVVLSFSFVQPLLWMLFFGFLFERYGLEEWVGEGSGRRRDLTYLDFLAPGVCAMTVLFGASQSGIGWIRDLQTGFLPRVLLYPADDRAILLGKVLADVLRLLAQAFFVFLLALLLGLEVEADLGAVALAVVGLGLFAATFSCLSCAIALTTRAQEAMAVFVHVVNMPLLFTSTALVPAKQMPDWLEGVSRWSPLTLAVDGLRGALLFGESPSVLWQLGPLAVLAFVLFFAAAAAMGRARKGV